MEDTCVEIYNVNGDDFYLEQEQYLDTTFDTFTYVSSVCTVHMHSNYTGPILTCIITQSVCYWWPAYTGGQTSNGRGRLSSSSVTLHGGPAGGFVGEGQAMTACPMPVS